MYEREEQVKSVAELVIAAFKSDKAYLVGWGMNSRGAVELALAYSAYKLEILNTELYTAIILMTFVSTLIFPLVFTRMVKTNKNIME